MKEKNLIHQPWTRSQEQLLVKLFEQKWTNAEIAKRLNRSKCAVAARLSKLKLTQQTQKERISIALRKRKSPSGFRLSPKQREKLKALYADHSINAIACMLNTSWIKVQHDINRLIDQGMLAPKVLQAGLSTQDMESLITYYPYYNVLILSKKLGVKAALIREKINDLLSLGLLRAEDRVHMPQTWDHLDFIWLQQQAGDHSVSELMHKFGCSRIRMKNVLRKNQLHPKPKEVPEELSAEEIQLLIQYYPKYRVPKLASLIGKNQSVIQRTISSLISQGKLKEVLDKPYFPSGWEIQQFECFKQHMGSCTDQELALKVNKSLKQVQELRFKLSYKNRGPGKKRDTSMKKVLALKDSHDIPDIAKMVKMPQTYVSAVLKRFGGYVKKGLTDATS